MQTVTVQIKNSSALKTLASLEDKQFISIVDRTDFDSPALSGEPLSISEFKNWISSAEDAETISLSDTKARWAKGGNK